MATVTVMPMKRALASAGVEFRLVGRHRRAVYQQFDGQFELGDACTCEVSWEPFRVTRRIDCPIDQHKILARRKTG